MTLNVCFIFRLQDENDKLVGKYTIHSQQLQSEFINLPDTVEVFLHAILSKLFIDFPFYLGAARVGIEVTSRINNRETR